MTLKEYMDNALPEIETVLDQALPGEDTFPPIIHKAMRYSTLGGGKRLRALLILATCEMLGGKREAALQAGAAVEMLHAYSLVHDDLPCMDDDDLRRGKPTNHKVFGEGLAVLAGDALLTQSFACLADLVNLGVAPPVVVRIIQEVARSAGSLGLIGGQVVDLESEGNAAGEETLRYIHTHKTGALFRACLQIGGLLGGARHRELEALDSFAHEFGLAFQIVDDILDITGNTEQLGKPAGSDVRQEKATYPALFGLKESKAMAQECIRRAAVALEIFETRANTLLELAQFVVERTS